MKATSKNPKPFWEMNKEELAEATKEFDRELRNDTFHPLGPEKRSIWERLQCIPTTSSAGSGRESSTVRIRSRADLKLIRGMVKKAALACLKRLKTMADLDPLQILAHFKFDTVGHNPLDPVEDMNLVEQINQSATLLVGCAAVEYLLRKHPSQEGYVISRPTARGYDLWAIDVSVAAEVFAATTPGSNRKLRRDLDAILKNKDPFHLDPPKHRYVFFVSRSLKGFPTNGLRKASDPVFGEEVWHLVCHGRTSVTVVRLPEKAVFDL